VAVEAAKGIVTFSFCSLGMMEGKEIVTKVIDPSPSPDEPRTMLADTGSATKVSGKAQVHGFEEIGKGVHAQQQAHYLSLISVPIGDLGVFQVASLEPDAFSKNDTRLLELLFGHTAAAIKRIRLQTELKEQAIHDSLTGLHNRFYLATVLDQEVKRSKRYHHGMTFIMIDINRFKEINDSYGHQVGDEVLRGVAALLREAVRESDIVVRYGGDEFLIVLLATTADVDRIKERIAQKASLLSKHNGQVAFPVTLSIGSASWDPKGRQSVGEILNEADKKMYDNKKKHNGQAHGGNHA
jgi:diguanylate cyclase (GGDEF)-like protein